jgi:spore coat protein U-like protein
MIDRKPSCRLLRIHAALLPALLLALLVALAAPPALAQSSSNCTLAITSPLSFGTYSGSQIRSSTPFHVTCTSGTWYITLYAGSGAGATENVRYLTGPTGAELSYQLYRDSAYSQVWGSTYPTNTYNGTNTFQGTIYAQVNGAQTAPPGTYTDTVNSATSQFTLTTVIPANCSIAANALSFGTYGGTLLKANSTISVTCTNTTPYSVGLNAGSTSGASVSNRLMSGSSSATLQYALYSNSGYTTNWGNASGSWVSGTGTGSAQTLTVYGQIPAGQYPKPGSYTDTVIATLSY